MKTFACAEKHPTADVQHPERLRIGTCRNSKEVVNLVGPILGQCPKPKRRDRATAGFTLTEIMVVLIVIGIIAAAIIPQFIGTTQDAKLSAAKGNVSELEAAVERFYVHMDRYPTTEEGLKVLVQAPTGEETKWRGPYIKMLRNDPWGQPYQYRSPGTHHTSSFDLWSK